MNRKRSVKSSRSGPRRLGAWLHQMPASKREMDKVIAGLSDRGINLLIASFKNWTGPTFYPSAHAYTEKGFEDGTLLRHAIDRCHEAGIEYEAWTCTFPESGRSRLLEQHPECRAVCRDGSEYRVKDANGEAWACPARDATQDHELALCREVLARYPGIDGLHLDYIRYSSTDTCYCAACRKEFRSLYGMDLLKDVMPGGSEGKAFDAYVRWRCGHIRSFVAKAKKAADQAGVRLTAAVFPFYPSILYDLGQDWVGWCRDGLLDAAYPMNYNWSDRMVGLYTDLHVQQLKGSRAQLCEGLALKDRMRDKDLQKLGTAALDRGSDGLIFFSVPTLLKFSKRVLKPFLR